MKEFTITLSDAEVKALETDMVSIQEWLDNAIHNKARKVTDKIVEKLSDKQADRLSVEEKNQLIQEATLETAAERNARLDTEIAVE